MKEMPKKADLQEIDVKIRSLKKTAQELNQLSDDFPSLARNTARILASIKMLEINISDIVSLGEPSPRHPGDQ
jgi:hypothetical protein